MKGLRRRYPLMALFAVAIGAVLALATGAQAAVQVKSPPNHVIAIETTATLQANGAAVLTTMDVVCPKGVTVTVSVTVTQAINDTIVTATNTHDFSTCTGKPQAISMGAVATTKPLAKGVAWGQASLWYYTNASHGGWDERTIHIN